mgnify:CR=1 FL=1
MRKEIHMFKNIKLINKIKKLKNIHIEIENEYVEYVKKYVPEKEFEYKNINLSKKKYLKKNFLSIIMLLILVFNKMKHLKNHGLMIHAIRNIITNTDNLIDCEDKGNMNITKLKNPVLKNVMSLLIADEILERELAKICKTENIYIIKQNLLKSIYEIAKGEEIRKVKNGEIMGYDEVIDKIHTKIGGELLAVSMVVPHELSKNEKLYNLKKALFEIGLSLQLLDDIVDIKEDYLAETQNAFYSYLIENEISEVEITDFIKSEKMTENIKKLYEKIVKKSINQGLSGFEMFEKNGLEIGYKEGIVLMEFMFKNRGMEKEWKIFEMNNGK